MIISKIQLGIKLKNIKYVNSLQTSFEKYKFYGKLKKIFPIQKVFLILNSKNCKKSIWN